MKMTLAEAFDMINRGETPEQYEKRVRKLRRYYNELYELQDALEILDGTQPGDEERAQKKRRRLEKVEQMIESLK